MNYYHLRKIKLFTVCVPALGLALALADPPANTQAPVTATTGTAGYALLSATAASISGTINGGQLQAQSVSPGSLANTLGAPGSLTIGNGGVSFLSEGLANSFTNPTNLALSSGTYPSLVSGSANALSAIALSQTNDWTGPQTFTSASVSDTNSYSTGVTIAYYFSGQYSNNPAGAVAVDGTSGGGSSYWLASSADPMFTTGTYAVYTTATGTELSTGTVGTYVTGTAGAQPALCRDTDPFYYKGYFYCFYNTSLPSGNSLGYSTILGIQKSTGPFGPWRLACNYDFSSQLANMQVLWTPHAFYDASGSPVINFTSYLSGSGYQMFQTRPVLTGTIAPFTQFTNPVQVSGSAMAATVFDGFETYVPSLGLYYMIYDNQGGSGDNIVTGTAPGVFNTTIVSGTAWAAGSGYSPGEQPNLLFQGNNTWRVGWAGQGDMLTGTANLNFSSVGPFNECSNGKFGPRSLFYEGKPFQTQDLEAVTAILRGVASASQSYGASQLVSAGAEQALVLSGDAAAGTSTLTVTSGSAPYDSQGYWQATTSGGYANNGRGELVTLPGGITIGAQLVINDHLYGNGNFPLQIIGTTDLGNNTGIGGYLDATQIGGDKWGWFSEGNSNQYDQAGSSVNYGGKTFQINDFTTNTNAFTAFRNGHVALSGTADTGEVLQVTGNSRVNASAGWVTTTGTTAASGPSNTGTAALWEKTIVNGTTCWRALFE